MSKIALITIATIIIWRQLIPLHQLIANFPLNDFSVYVDGTKSTLRGENPYTQWFFDRYNYPPAATLFFLPITLLPTNTAEYFFSAISLTFLWLTITCMPSNTKVRPHWSLKLFLFALSLKFFPVKLTLALGQINVIILGLLVSSHYFQQKRPYMAGVLLGIATAIKLTPAPLILYFLIKKNTQAVIGTLVTLTILTILAILLFGFPLTHYYYTQVLPELNSQVTQETLNMTYMNQSITALLGRFGIFGITNSLIRYLVCSFGIIFISLNRHKFSDLQLFSVLLVLITLFLPIFVWQHHFVATIPLLFAYINSQRYAIPTIFYILLNLYYSNSGRTIATNPFISTHFLAIAALLLIISLVVLPSPHKQAKSHLVHKS